MDEEEAVGRDQALGLMLAARTGHGEIEALSVIGRMRAAGADGDARDVGFALTAMTILVVAGSGSATTAYAQISGLTQRNGSRLVDWLGRIGRAIDHDEREGVIAVLANVPIGNSPAAVLEVDSEIEGGQVRPVGARITLGSLETQSTSIRFGSFDTACGDASRREAVSRRDRIGPGTIALIARGCRGLAR